MRFMPIRRQVLCTIVGFMLAPAWPQAGFAQSSLANLSIEELANLRVTTASKDPEPIPTTPAAIYVITQDDIRRSGVINIADALRLAPGVEVGRISSTTWAVGIRG